MTSPQPAGRPAWADATPSPPASILTTGELTGARIVYSLDPGISSGFVKAELKPGKPVKLHCGEGKFSHGQLWAKFVTNKPYAIVCESFEFRNKQQNNVELFSRELIGVVRLYSELTPCKLYMQTAAVGKGHFTDVKLKELRLYIKGQKHSRDAIRHFLQWYYFGAGFEYNQEKGFELVG